MTELMPCPFCGKSVARIGRTPLMNDTSGYHVNCSTVAGGCNMEGPWRNTKDEAIAAWNTRPAPSPSDAAECSDDCGSRNCAVCGKDYPSPSREGWLTEAQVRQCSDISSYELTQPALSALCDMALSALRPAAVEGQ